MNRVNFLIFIFIFWACNGEKTSLDNHYSFSIDIYPEESRIETELELTYFHRTSSTNTLEFLLHEKMQLLTINAEYLDNYLFDTVGNSPLRFAPEAGVLKLFFKKPLEEPKPIQIKFHYIGYIDTVSVWKTNRITQDWVELNNYSPWFPLMSDINGFKFEGKVYFNEPYSLAGNSITSFEKDYWKIASYGNVNDIVITASRNFTHKNLIYNTSSIELSSAVSLADSTQTAILKMNKEILELYNSWYGKNRSDVKIIITPRSIGGGYARQGLILLSKISDEDFFKNKTGYARYFAHELSHFWWSKADTETWEDWMNESFAEYSAMMIIREIFGEDEYKRRINKKEANIDDLPPIRGLDRGNDIAYKVLYNKGCYLLFELDQRIGKENFISLLNSTYKQKINTTEKFLELLKDKTNENISSGFSDKLN